MIRLTAAQMRHSLGRLTAAGVATALGAAFIAATLLGGALIRDTAYEAMTARLGDADVVADSPQRPLTEADLAKLTELPEVAAVHGDSRQVVHIASAADDGAGGGGGGGRGGGGDGDGGPGAAAQDIGVLMPLPADPSLTVHEVVEGSLPTAEDEVAITAASAARLDVGVGDRVWVQWELWDPETDTTRSREAVLTVSGLLADPSALAGGEPAALVTAPAYRELLAGVPIEVSSVLVAGAAGTDPQQVAAAVQAADPGLVVRTAEEEAEAQTEMLVGESQVLTYLVLAFAALAMFVAGIVITNTFQVLVAHRARTLALLRCVGATRSQIRRSVLLEASVLGLVSGAVGLLVGLGVGQAALWGLAAADLPLEVPTALTVTPAVVLVPLVTAVAVTLAAALTPARVATRVAPLAALRPPEAPSTARGGGRVRLWTAVLLGLGGLLLLGGAVTGALVAEEPQAVGLLLAAGVLGGMLSFTAVMVGAVFVLPGAVRLLGRLVCAVTPREQRRTVTLTTDNATRNPRRTAATASALLIGVTLVVLMATGAETARSTLDAELARQFPVDLQVETFGSADGGRPSLTDTQVAAVAGAPGVQQVTTVPSAQAMITIEGDARTEWTEWYATLRAVDPIETGAVLRDASLLDELEDGVVIVDAEAAQGSVEEGDRVRVVPLDAQDEGGAAADAEGTVVTLAVRDGVGLDALTTPATLREVAGDDHGSVLWARLADGEGGAAVDAVRDALSEVSGAGEVPVVSGAAAIREDFSDVIDTLLAVVLGLLGVAVVIALIGVANTLSLSVIERRRENAVLRATGLTAGQLRGMLATEGMLLAGVGTLIGTVLGLLYGWAGSAVLLGGVGTDLALAVPWDYLAAVLAVALAAGLLASVLPARSAVRTPPVAALAVE